MALYDALQADVLHNTVKRVILLAAPSQPLKQQAEQMFEGVDGWRLTARIAAQLSPSVLRQGDWARISSLILNEAPSFYYELQVPPERWREKEGMEAYATAR